ncbi:tetratricopeptide repeat protein [uncultured Dokdonia sp.]|uniref:tetratricopeptide repeat protein n=1 Tax=uncultured Dokdonia sp. TaxID=575653 RepID=UPI0026196D71|nr:tetratricopeptide repeat protein [uncultured Dokdonia sp.]
MTKISKLLLVVVTFLLSCTTYAQQTELLFEAGNEHYAQGRFQEAVDAYKRILDQKVESAALYFNLANAHYKLNNVAPTVYYYEKALQLAPSDPDIRNNAAFAENMKIDAIEPLPKNTLQEWINSVVRLFTIDGWAKIAIVCMILFVLSFLIYYFSYNTTKKRLFFISSIAVLILGIISVSFAYTAFAKAGKDNPAIVFTPEVEVKSEPNLSSTLAFTLHEGTKVFVLEEVNEWNRIKLIDGKTGWIPKNDIKLLNNF